jgi:hypothetical protein
MRHQQTRGPLTGFAPGRWQIKRLAKPRTGYFQ